jgi:hypothetical protein
MSHTWQKPEREPDPFVVESAYLYSIWGNVFRVYFGKVIRSHRIVSFKVKTGKRMTCHADEGKVYNGVVWFSEPDERKARETLIQFYIVKLTEYQEGVVNTNQRIKLLKGK